MYLNLILIIVFFACFASLIGGGLWSNLIVLINVVTAALVATCYYEPVADLAFDMMPAYGAAWDFVIVWLMFAGSLGLFGLATDLLSRHKVRFLKPIDQYGGIFIGCWVGWVTVCFTTMTLHMAPLPRNFAGGDFQPRAESRMFFGLAPDHQWMGFMQRMSHKGYVRNRENLFDPRADFIYKYAQRRLSLEKGGSWAVPDRVKAAAAKASAESAKTDTSHAPSGAANP